MKTKFFNALSLAVIMAMLVTSLVLADQVVNTIDNTIDPASETRTIDAGESTTVGFYIKNINNNGGDPVNSCNVSGTFPATVKLSVPEGVTATPSELVFTACDVIQNVTFSSSEPDSYDIGISEVTGGRTGGAWDTAPAAFALEVDEASDTTPPVVTPSVSGMLGNNGWYVGDVTVSWTVNDPESTVTSAFGCDPSTVTTDTFGQTFTCSATSAGGTSSQSVTIKRDATAPTSVSGMPNRAADYGTWYNHAVGVVFIGNDATSGIASCTTTNYSGPDGSGVTVNGSCTDNAGNTSAPVASSVFNYDGTKPTISAAIFSGTSGLNSWYVSDVTVRFTCQDNLSGIPVSVCPPDQILNAEGIGISSTAQTVADAAGNMSDPSNVISVNIDKTAPVVTVTPTRSPDHNGWYNAPVYFDTTGSDDTSGVASCSALQTYTTPDGMGLTVNGSCTDNAGNVGNGTSAVFKFDDTDPTLTWNIAINNGDSFYFGFVPAYPPNPCVAVDSLSGPDGCNVAGYATTVGSHTLTATAYDIAGNSYSEQRTYTVLAWTLNGFYQPVDMGKLNIAKNGSTVPLKFEVFAGPIELTNTGIVSTFVQKLTCGTGIATDDIENYATGGTSLRYDTTGGQFIFNWQTPKLAGNCYRVTLTTADGSSIFADFKLK